MHFIILILCGALIPSITGDIILPCCEDDEVYIIEFHKCYNNKTFFNKMMNCTSYQIFEPPILQNDGSLYLKESNTTIESRR